MLEMEVKLPLRVIMLNFWRKYMVEEVSFNFDRMKSQNLNFSSGACSIGGWDSIAQKYIRNISRKLDESWATGHQERL